MINTNQDISKILQSIKGVAPKHCDSCGHKYGEADFNVLKNQTQQLIIHLRCQNCGNAYMLNIFNPQQGLVGSTRAQLNLDIIDPAELMNFASQQPINMNDALDAYNLFLKSPIISNYFESKLLNNSKQSDVNIPQY